MKLEDIKVGEAYNVCVQVKIIGTDYIQCSPVLQGGVLSKLWPTSFAVEDASAFSPVNGIKNTETAPKYDPNRKFRKGDTVKLIDRDSRHYADYDPHTKLQEGNIYTVLENEQEVIEGGCPDIRIADKHGEYEALFYFLELVTPVEELEPYMVKELKDSFIVYHDCTKIALNNTSPVRKFMKASHPNAQAAAEAECARLNAEYRKEQA